MNKEVHLTKRVRTAAGLRYCPAVEAASNGRIKADVVLVDGREEKHTEGAYYIEWRESGKRIRLSVGTNAQDAANAKFKKAAELNARNLGVAVVPANGSTNGTKQSLSDAVADYLKEIERSKKPNTLSAYRTALEYFLESCSKAHVEDIDRRDMLDFSAFLRDRKHQSPRSAHNRFLAVRIFLKAKGVRGILNRTDNPRYVEEEPEVYEREELDKLFGVCDDNERLWFEFFLQTGFREQEAMYACWSDVNFTAKTIRVSHKPQYRWTPKAYKEREVPLSDKLAAALTAHRKKASKTCPLIFSTGNCKPKLDFLKNLKAAAERAGLDKDDFWLHRFRATFATWSLWANVDLRTVQLWLGHSDIKSTMRYLKPSRSRETRAKVNQIFA